VKRTTITEPPPDFGKGDPFAADEREQRVLRAKAALADELAGVLKQIRGNASLVLDKQPGQERVVLLEIIHIINCYDRRIQAVEQAEEGETE
jgi:hypothetical protein